MQLYFLLVNWIIDDLIIRDLYNEEIAKKLIFVRQEIQHLRSAVLRQKEEQNDEEEKEKRTEVRNTSSQTYGRGGSFRRQKRER